jgi:hypothetical protein
MACPRTSTDPNLTDAMLPPGFLQKKHDAPPHPTRQARSYRLFVKHLPTLSKVQFLPLRPLCSSHALPRRACRPSPTLKTLPGARALPLCGRLSESRIASRDSLQIASSYRPSCPRRGGGGLLEAMYWMAVGPGGRWLTERMRLAKLPRRPRTRQSAVPLVGGQSVLSEN